MRPAPGSPLQIGAALNYWVDIYYTDRQGVQTVAYNTSIADPLIGCPKQPFYGPLQFLDLVTAKTQFICQRDLPEPALVCRTCGNPVALEAGIKVEHQTDYSGPTGLVFKRTYRSDTNQFQHGFLATSRSDTTAFVPLGGCYPGVNNVTGATYCFPRVGTGTNTVEIARPESLRQLRFGATSLAALTTDVNDRVTAIPGGGWQVRNGLDDSLETYDAAGKLMAKQSRSGQTQTMVYTGDTLTSVTDDFAHTIGFAYDGQGRMTQMTDPAGGLTTYDYDANGNQIKVTYADGTFKQNLFENAALPYALTGVIDENGVRFSTFAFDNASGRAISTEHFGSVEKYSFDYSSYPAWVGVTDPLNTPRTFGLSNVQGSYKTTNITQPCGTAGCAGTVSAPDTVDGNGNVLSHTDFNGNQTTYTYDTTRNLQLSRTEGLTSTGATTPQTRTTTTTWHPTYRIPATITEPTTAGNKITTFTHDVNGNVLTKSVAVGGITRAWSWTYDQYGRVLTATDPRLNTAINTYYPNDASQGTRRGMLNAVTNAAGHTTIITSYNAHGQPLSITDANGLVTDLTYDLRLRLTSRTVGGEITRYDYDNAGQLIKVTLPDLSTLQYSYDGAHRLFQIQDSLANRTVYTLDNMGNRLKDDYGDASNTLMRTHSRVYDALNRLQQDIGGSTPATQITQYGYDNNGNQTVTTDPLNRSTTQNYDGLNRLLQVIDPYNGAAAPTKYDYDTQNNLTNVTDPKSLATVYVYNGFNELTSQSSPDTGSTSFTYDAAGNLFTKTDARSVTATYSYDALNRVSSISYPAYQSDPAETVIYTYDSCVNGKGRLCSITDKTGTISYGYDTHGRVLSKAGTTLGITQSIAYGYNSAGQMDRMALPSGKLVTYAYVNNRVTAITYDGTPVVKDAIYKPFGPLNQWTWGNDSVASPNKHTRYFDLDGRLGRIESGNGIDPSFIVYDAASRITDLLKLDSNSVADVTRSASYGYDALDRLTTVTPYTGNPNPPLGYTYDGVGNRLTSTVAGSVTNYGYGTSSHRLNGLTGAITKSFSYDSDGNRTNDGSSTWSYGGNNRPVSVVLAGAVVQAGINALGQRVTKTVNGTVTRFMYDEAGRLIGEYDVTGKAQQETLWFNDLPVAVIK